MYRLLNRCGHLHDWRGKHGTGSVSKLIKIFHFNDLFLKFSKCRCARYAITGLLYKIKIAIWSAYVFNKIGYSVWGKSDIKIL